MTYKPLETDQKALEINLDDKIYGTFAEIGAGQEVARYFFQVGGAAGTIAKTMSAYDKVYSDHIYGNEPSGRYVCESRIYKMLAHEYELMESRLRPHRPNTHFFAFADSIAALNYARTISGDGWLGVRFQLNHHDEPNDIVIHVRMLDNDNRLQQQAVGVVGVNLVYGCFRYCDNPEVLLQSLMDGLKGRIMIDMVRMTGPQFADLDNRLLSLYLIKHQMSDVAIFAPDGRNIHASEFLYKKNILVVRGSFRPVTLVNQDMINTSYDQFRAEPDIDPSKTVLLSEITYHNLTQDGQLDPKDFLDRADLLCALGQTVMVTNCENYTRLINYLLEYKFLKLGIVIGVQPLFDLINEKFHKNMDGSILSAFGELFTRNVRIYVYPLMQEGSEELLNSNNLIVPEGIKFLYKYLLENQHIVDIKQYNPNILHIYSKKVLELLQHDEGDWQKFVPTKVAQLIKEKCLFHYPFQKIEFDY
ncbi:MAG: TonB-dependent receptor [Saprospiraceae bacterium]|nr:TonB-dependent receptor [Saprospiraceae bacterium]